MTHRSALLVVLSAVLVGLTLVARAPRSGPMPLMTDTPIIVHPEATVAPARAVEVGRLERARPLPAYTDPDRAGVAAFVDGRYEEAAELFQQAIDDDPRHAESLSNLGQVLTRLGRHEEAIEYFERALEIDPSRWAYRFNLAHALAVLEEWDRTVTQYRLAADLSPADYVTRYNLGQALHHQGDDRAAIEAYRMAIDLNPADPSFHLSLGLSHERLQEWDDALAAYQRYLAMVPADGESEVVKRRIVALMEYQDRARAGS